jgi:adenosylcobinamide-GDP ribazoletransferase
MRGAMAELALAGEFLTRLPLGGMRAYSAERMARAPHWFATVGLGLGLAGAAVLGVLAHVLPHGVAVALTLGALVVVTGALHEDGLADSLDGLGGGRTPERALDIMRDSRIGSYGALGLGFALAVQGLSLVALPLAQAMATLVLAQTLGRALMTDALARDTYLRKQGTGSGLDAPLGKTGVLRVGAAVVVAIVLGGMALPLGALGTALVCGVGAGTLWRAWVLNRLGGQTGDTLGALHMVAATATLLGASAWA